MAHQEIHPLLFYVLTLGLILIGLEALSNINPWTHRAYRWLVRNLLLDPLRWLLRQVGRILGDVLLWSARQLGQLILAIGRLLGRGLYYAWVRLTT